MYKRSSAELRKDEISDERKQLILNHCKDNGLENVFENDPLIIHTISTSQKRKLFRTVELTNRLITILTEQTLLNFVTDDRNVNRIISVAIKNLQYVKEFEPVKIGNKTIDDSGFELRAVFNGLGLSASRSNTASYFLPVAQGSMYEMAKKKLIG